MKPIINHYEKERLREDKGKILPKHFDVLGDIAVISLPSDQLHNKYETGRAIAKSRRNIKTVLLKRTMLEGDFRTPGFEVIWGENKTVTTHKEFGFIYNIDLARVFFNPRLLSERRRVSSMVSPGEDVIVPFSGAGPFAVPAASFGASVVCLEKNPVACRYLRKNAVLNRVSGNIDVVNGDACDLARIFDFEFDRAIVPAAYGMENIVDTVLDVVKTGGKIHLYTFIPDNEKDEKICRFRGAGLETEFFKRCGNVCPGISRYVFDLLKL
ncbi:class I SAM-dependent methyltransferase family protein [Methanoplanus sp. FWC-SCC4]|uniref:Class I SAM-dependent methyltransferase family protein n=1 Tax=Methanochimaera problematica TaxID=2609417 RepID=A0AA97FFG1_9EURY|nr:hypothetical protein [Methanoplanus sp. FWC-SCC4]WOF17209.1 class I SAM-dependent methyltransferase family protein [Methanoplanus sp. FWC-SCC4]